MMRALVGVDGITTVDFPRGVVGTVGVDIVVGGQTALRRRLTRIRFQHLFSSLLARTASSACITTQDGQDAMIGIIKANIDATQLSGRFNP